MAGSPGVKSMIVKIINATPIRIGIRISSLLTVYFTMLRLLIDLNFSLIYFITSLLPCQLCVVLLSDSGIYCKKIVKRSAANRFGKVF